MEQQAVDLVKQSDSTILITIAVIVFLAVIAVPFIKAMAAIRSTARKEAQAREDMLIQVIKANTEVNASLKTLIEADQKNCNECKREQLSLWQAVQQSQEQSFVKLVEIQGVLRKEPTACSPTKAL
jgi:hypothetical protein